MRGSKLQFHNVKERCGDRFISTMHVVLTSQHVYNQLWNKRQQKWKTRDNMLCFHDTKYRLTTHHRQHHICYWTLTAPLHSLTSSGPCWTDWLQTGQFAANLHKWCIALLYKCSRGQPQTTNHTDVMLTTTDHTCWWWSSTTTFCWS